jgi:hypothetical protein
MKVPRCHRKSYWSDVFDIVLLRVHRKFIKVWLVITVSSDESNTEFNFHEKNLNSNIPNREFDPILCNSVWNFVVMERPCSDSVGEQR